MEATENTSCAVMKVAAVYKWKQGLNVFDPDSYLKM